jgi:hypothetical protein
VIMWIVSKSRNILGIIWSIFNWFQI